MPNDELEDYLIHKIIARVVGRFLDWVIMVKLSNSPQGGYDILKYVYEHYGVMVSPGTIYSYLESLERKGLVIGTSVGKKRVYSLTTKGKEILETLHKSKKFRSFIHQFVVAEELDILQ